MFISEYENTQRPKKPSSNTKTLSRDNNLNKHQTCKIKTS